MSEIKYLEFKTDLLIWRLTLRQYLKRGMEWTASAARRAIPVTRSLVLKASGEKSDQKDRRDQSVRLGNLSKARRARRATQANQSSGLKAHPDPQAKTANPYRVNRVSKVSAARKVIREKLVLVSTFLNGLRESIEKGLKFSITSGNSFVRYLTLRKAPTTSRAGSE